MVKVWAVACSGDGEHVRWWRLVFAVERSTNVLGLGCGLDGTCRDAWYVEGLTWASVGGVWCLTVGLVGTAVLSVVVGT